MRGEWGRKKVLGSLLTANEPMPAEVIDFF